jgi:hypothetical protein
VYAASSAGLFRTDDAGDAWTRLTGLDLASGTVRGVAVAG